MDRKEQIQDFVMHPEKLLQKEPFTRGMDQEQDSPAQSTVLPNGTVTATVPRFKRRIVTQEQFMRELDPACHNCLFDMNIPSICVKMQDGNYYEVMYEKDAMPFQQIIARKQVLHLTGNPMEFTLLDTDPTEKQMRNFQTMKQYWKKRNQDGMKRKLATKQLTLGDGGLLYYMNHKGEIRSRIIAYDKGYVICSHNDDNGERVCEAVYYNNGQREIIDMYTDTEMYRFVNSYDDKGAYDGWKVANGYPVKHGFSEIPLVTKRGDVAWNDVQSIIESWEVLNNVFNAIQKRYGWGLLYIKGRFNEKAQKIAGSVVLNDTSLDGKGEAKFLTPPSPEGTINTLDKLEDDIMLGSSTTFLLPKDIKTGSDISGTAIKLISSEDIEKAEDNAAEYKNVADKMMRLFTEGLAKELVNKGLNKEAVTEFQDLNMTAAFKIWIPYSKAEYNQMLLQLTGGGLLSKKTGIEKNTESAPDEYARLLDQAENTLQTNVTETQPTE